MSKGKDKAERTAHPEYLALVAKWDGFLAKIEARFDESLVHAEDAVLGNLALSDFDMQPTMQAWSGMNAQIRLLSEKIGKTFKKKVQPQMLDYVERWDIIDQEQKGVNLSYSLHKRLRRFDIVIEGKVARMFYDHAVQFLNEDFQCTQCGGALQINKDLFRAHYVSCDYCNTVNTFMPNDKIAELESCADGIAKHFAIEEWDEKEAAFDLSRAILERDDDAQHSKLRAAYERRETADHTYWTEYYSERARLNPRYQDTLERDINTSMKRSIYDDRKRSVLNY